MIVAPTSDVASAPPKTAPGGKWVASAYLLAALAIAAGHAIDAATHDVASAVKDDFSLFAVFYAFAQAEERLLEPISRLWQAGTRDTKTGEVATAASQRRTAQTAAVAAAAAGDQTAAKTNAESAGTAATSEAEKLAEIAKIRANKEVFLWGLATAIAAIACGWLGIRFLEVVLDFGNAQPTGDFRMFDLAITALVIGSGTKPLHDLIDRIQKPKAG